MTKIILGSRLIESTDTDPIPVHMSDRLTQVLNDAGFAATDIGHHISVITSAGGHNWECAVIYLEGETLWIKALAERWWLLFSAGDRQQRYAAFWQAIDQALDGLEFDGEIQQGTAGELDDKVVQAILREAAS